MGRIVVAAVVTAVALVGVGLSARQAVQKVPGPGGGIVEVRGVVEVGNMLTVNAVQQGEWRTISAIASMPPVSVATPEIVRRGGKYTIVWSGGEREVITISNIFAGGWIAVEGPRSRMINLAQARSLEVAQ